jgi:hypothetical protein
MLEFVSHGGNGWWNKGNTYVAINTIGNRAIGFRPFVGQALSNALENYFWHEGLDCLHRGCNEGSKVTLMLHT